MRQTVSVPDFVSASRAAFTSLMERQSGKRAIVSVLLQGPTAAVSWTESARKINATLVLPEMPLAGRLTRAQADRMTGYWLHEVGHTLHSDPDIMRQAAQEDPRLPRILNALEDPRMEHALIESGAARNARGVLTFLVRHMAQEGIDNGWSVNARDNIAWSIALLGRVLVHNYKVPEVAGALAQADPDVRQILDLALDGIRDAQCNRDLLPVARQIVALMTEHDQSDQIGDSQGDDSQGDDSQGDGSQGDDSQGDGSQGDGSQGDGSQGDDSQGDGSQGDDSQGDDSQGNGSQGDGSQGDGSQGAQRGSARYGSGGDAEPSPSDLQEEIKKTAPDPERYDEKRALGILANPGPIKKLRNRQHRTASKLEQTLTDTRAALPNAGRCKRDIARLVRSPARIWTDRQQDSGRLDQAALARAVAGDPRAFIRRQDEEGDDALIWFLLDLSGSMAGTRIQLAGALAVHLCEAVESMAGRVAIYGFEDSTQVLPHHASACVLRPMKPEHKRVRACAEEFIPHNLQHSCRSGTPLSHAIGTAGALMSQQDATRRVLCVLTDGDCNDGVRTAEHVAEHVQTSGVEVIGLLLDYPSKDQPFPLAEHIESYRPSKLAQTGLEAIRKALR